MTRFANMIIALIFSLNAVAQYKVELVLAQAPDYNTKDSIYLAGSFNNWSPGDEDYIIKSLDGKTGWILDLPKGKYEYKLTRGNWHKSETTASGRPTGNRAFELNNDTTIYISVDGWNDHFNAESKQVARHTASPQVQVMDTAFYMPQLNRKRRVWIYLPADYEKTNKAYPVLYMHDGQNLFDDATSYSGEWGVDECLDSMIAKGKKAVIVVGIDNGLTHRMSEYNPWQFQNFGPGEGDQYVDFLVKSLKPYIDKHYRTSKGKEDTYVSGSSMGGLISLYAILKYPQTFGAAGVFSPAFWTAQGIDSSVIKNVAKVKGRLFVYAGGDEGPSMVPDMLRIDSIIRTRSTTELKEVIDPEAKHNEAAWRKYFPVFYEWAIDRELSK